MRHQYGQQCIVALWYYITHFLKLELFKKKNLFHFSGFFRGNLADIFNLCFKKKKQQLQKLIKAT